MYSSCSALLQPLVSKCQCNLTATEERTAMALDEPAYTRLVLISCGNKCMNEQSLVRGGMNRAYASYPLAEGIIAWAIEHTSESAIELVASSKSMVECMAFVKPQNSD